MLLLKKGYPEEDEFVFCTITNIQFHCVFAKLDEYDNKSGMIHISEVASGRIRNIREYVKEGKKIVCKVLRVNLEKGHIDLSLRRVNEAQRRGKINEIKQEQAAEKIVEFVAQQQKIKPLALFKTLYEAVTKKYDSLYDCFEDIVRTGASLEKLGIKKELADVVTEVVLQRVKPPEVHLGGTLQLTSYAENGAELVKQALKKGTGDAITIKYKAAGNYIIDVQGEEPKKTEKILQKSVDAILHFAKTKNIVAQFVRKE
ncbi:S1 RNA-binding domain-containing protein [Candidatus Woesearchaeota archaeon]|nr:S1 RNA-binding domain-containing protein [Candidatus Woesearchaeota archaeon]